MQIKFNPPSNYAMNNEVIFPKRVLKLRKHIIKTLSKFPNTKETTELLNNQSTTTLILHYISWIARFIPPRPRDIIIEPTATSDSRWKELSEEVNSLLKKVEKGNDLTAFLSRKVLTKGYSPDASKLGTTSDRWKDKDFILFTMGFHHFHLGKLNKLTGEIDRSNEVLLAKVTRKEFRVLAIFDHSVFNDPTTIDMSEEQYRLWDIFESNNPSSPAGGVVIQSLITTSGHPLHLTKLAQEYSYLITQVDPLLDDLDYIYELYKDSGVDVIPNKKTKLSWQFNLHEFGLIDSREQLFIRLRNGLDI